MKISELVVGDIVRVSYFNARMPLISISEVLSIDGGNSDKKVFFGDVIALTYPEPEHWRSNEDHMLIHEVLFNKNNDMARFDDYKNNYEVTKNHIIDEYPEYFL